MGEESGRLVGSDPIDPNFDGDGPSNLPSGLVAPNTFSGSVQTGAPYSEGDPELYSNEFASGMPPQGFEGDDETDERGQTRAHIAQTRAELSTSSDAIQEKLSPQNIAQQAKDTVKEATVGKAQE